MDRFSVCAACQQEVTSAPNRRFHSQINACPDCGPQLVMHTADNDENERPSSETPLTTAANLIRQGAVVAVLGIGGYQLVCDATNSAAVQRMRQIKHRPFRPLAVMVRTLQEAESLAQLNDAARAALTSAAGPIVLVTAREGEPPAEPQIAHSHAAQQELRPPETRRAEDIHPGLREIGLMLPSSPLHVLLLEAVGGPCVVTSANDAGDPILYRETSASVLETTAADACLSHDRGIQRPIDDSVVRLRGSDPFTIRCARGLAPLPLSRQTQHSLLAVGAHQKNAVALSNGHQTILGPHIGDLASLATRQRFNDQVQQLTHLYGVSTDPDSSTVVVHDRHPDLYSTQWARQSGLKTIAVQHHHAHVVAGMLEHNWLDHEALGIAMDGTGFGDDGTIWGGEFLLCTPTGYRRVARLRPFVLPGGEQAVHEPWRVALALLHDSVGKQPAVDLLAQLQLADEKSIRQLADLLDHGTTHNSPLFPVTSSAGRLFDGVASLLLNQGNVSTEGELAMKLEAACDTSEQGAYSIIVPPPDNTSPADERDAYLELDWRPLIQQLVSDLQQQRPAGRTAMKFHRGLAQASARVCCHWPDHPVVLTGGCFQNVLLQQEVESRLTDQGQTVGMPGQIPVNDGGLAAGQLAVAAAQLDEHTMHNKGPN